MKDSKKTAKYITSKQLTIKNTRKKVLVENDSVHSSREAAEIFRKFYDKNQLSIREEFHILILSRSNKVIGHSLISIGGTSATTADGKIIISTALQCAQASCILLCHNHPSNALKPSESDKKLTRQLQEFGKLIDFPILDHIILTENNYFSFADEGLL